MCYYDEKGRDELSSLSTNDHPLEAEWGSIPLKGERLHACRACQRYFSGLGAFDKHRTGMQCGVSPLKENPYLPCKGFWLDDQGIYPYGKKMTDKEREEVWRTT